jgi:hypothetical protein
VPHSTDKVDTPDCREDLIVKAAASWCRTDFDWVSPEAAQLVTTNPANQGFTSGLILDLAREWINTGGRIKCVDETRPNWRDKRHKHYDITITGLREFRDGLYVYMEISNPDEDEPEVSLLNAHPHIP